MLLAAFIICLKHNNRTRRCWVKVGLVSFGADLSASPTS
jgi:hypothetical protein